MMGLTKRQRECLNAVRAWQAKNGQMPSCEELRVELGLKSKSGVAHLLGRLEHRGAIKRIPGCARAIIIRKRRCPHCKHELPGPR